MMTSPSDPGYVTRTPFGDIESRMGIPPLEVLLAERDDLIREVAPLRAKHGPGGTYQDLRKVELSGIAAIIRAKAVEASVKLTEAAIDETAHASERYAAYVTEATEEKARWIELENRIASIGDLINRGNVVARFLASEAMLAR